MIADEVIDNDTGDIYVLSSNLVATRAFIGKVKAECTEILKKIAESCFNKQIFKSLVTHKIITYIQRQIFRMNLNFYGQSFLK